MMGRGYFGGGSQVDEGSAIVNWRRLPAFGLATLVFAATMARAEAPGIMARIAAGDGGWDYASIDPTGNRLFVSRADGVMTMDLSTRQVTAQFVPGERVHASFIIPGTSIGVSTNGNTDSVKLFDAASGAVKAVVKVGSKPDAATWDAATKTVWVMNAHDGTASIIDPVKQAVVGSVAIGGALESAVTDGKGRLFVNVEDKNELVAIDTRTRTVVRRTVLTGCDGPTGLALTRQGSLISACANNVAKTVSAATGALGADIAIGTGPDAVLYDSARDRAYIPAGRDGTLTVIDTRGVAKAVATIATQKGARLGAVDPATGLVYLPTARYAADGSERPKPVPGSFEVLVVKP